MKRAEVYWATLPPPIGRRPVVIATRTPALRYLDAIVVAQVSKRVRGNRSEILIGPREGLPRLSALNCDALITISKAALDQSPVGTLTPTKIRQFDRALSYALGIRITPTRSSPAAST